MTQDSICPSFVYFEDKEQFIYLSFLGNYLMKLLCELYLKYEMKMILDD